MIIPALLAFLGSVFVAIIFFIVIRSERRHGRRFFASRIRAWLDTKIDKIGDWMVRSINHFVKYILQLNWYYSIHSVLKSILKVIVFAYTYMENVFEKNRSITKQLRAEKRKLTESNHLHQMTAHRKDTTLTPAQKQKLNKKNLEGK